jgi:hypothetical protein
MVGNVKAATFEYNRRRVKDAPSLSLTLRTYCLGLLMEALSHLKTITAVNALVLINGHMVHLAQTQPLYTILHQERSSGKVTESEQLHYGIYCLPRPFFDILNRYAPIV